jgi:hypothetical protein
MLDMNIEVLQGLNGLLHLIRSFKAQLFVWRRLLREVTPILI